MSTGAIKAIKITSVAGAFWRGDAKREQMTRIYGISFPKKKMLDEYLVMLEEAKKRDHRKIGKEAAEGNTAASASAGAASLTLEAI